MKKRFCRGRRELCLRRTFLLLLHRIEGLPLLWQSIDRKVPWRLEEKMFVAKMKSTDNKKSVFLGLSNARELTNTLHLTTELGAIAVKRGVALLLAGYRFGNNDNNCEVYFLFDEKQITSFYHRIMASASGRKKAVVKVGVETYNLNSLKFYTLIEVGKNCKLEPILPKDLPSPPPTKESVSNRTKRVSWMSGKLTRAAKGLPDQ
jgi:hypothetical protein